MGPAMFKVTQGFALAFIFLLVTSTHPFASTETKSDINLVCENVSVKTMENWGFGWKRKDPAMLEYMDLSITLQGERCIPKASNANINNPYSLKKADAYFKCVYGKVNGNEEHHQEITINRYSGDTSWKVVDGLFKMGIQTEGIKIENKYKCGKKDKLF